MKYLIISQPKAGTYLCSEVFRLLGIDQTYLHLSEEAYSKYDPNNIEQGRTKPEKFNHAVPLVKSIKLVQDGEFAATHSVYDKKNHALFQDFKKVLLMRNMQDIRQSFDRWSRITGRPNRIKAGGMYRKKFREIAKWQEQPDVFVLDFNDMKHQNIQKLDELQMHLFGVIKHDSKTIITQALAANTLTKV